MLEGRVNPHENEKLNIHGNSVKIQLLLPKEPTVIKKNLRSTYLANQNQESGLKSVSSLKSFYHDNISPADPIQNPAGAKLGKTS